MQWMIWVWLGVVVASLVIEFISVSMTSLWFAVGGFVALIMAAFNVGLIWQIVVFSIVSLVFLFSLRKIALKFLFKNKDDKTNKDAIIGKEYFLLDEINEKQMGQVKIDGVVWSCVAENPTQTIKKDAKVVIKNISGNKLIVDEIKDAEPVKIENN